MRIFILTISLFFPSLAYSDSFQQHLESLRTALRNKQYSLMRKERNELKTALRLNWFRPLTSRSRIEVHVQNGGILESKQDILRSVRETVTSAINVLEHASGDSELAMFHVQNFCNSVLKLSKVPLKYSTCAKELHKFNYYERVGDFSVYDFENPVKVNFYKKLVEYFYAHLKEKGFFNPLGVEARVYVDL